MEEAASLPEAAVPDLGEEAAARERREALREAIGGLRDPSVSSSAWTCSARTRSS